MEDNHRSTMASIGGSGGLQGSICPTATAMVFSAGETHDGRGTTSGSGSSAVSQSASNRGITDPKSRLFINDIQNPRKDESEINFRLQANQYLYPTAAFQDGRCTSIERVDRTRGLDGENQSERCIHSMPDPSTVETVLFI